MKRRFGDSIKMRRQSRKTRSVDDTRAESFGFILKTLIFWLITFTIDHFLQFRLEFFWPLWYMVNNINTAYKYQGFGLSFIFVCIAFTSDVLCYFFIPIQYLFFAASSWVWVHYVYHQERGFNVTTVFLYLVIILLESSVRLKADQHYSLNIDLCKPFAAHCVGNPLVTFGFTELKNTYFSFSQKLLSSSSQDGVDSDESSSVKNEESPSSVSIATSVANTKSSHSRKAIDTQDKEGKCNKLQNGTTVIDDHGLKDQINSVHNNNGLKDPSNYVHSTHGQTHNNHGLKDPKKHHNNKDRNQHNNVKDEPCSHTNSCYYNKDEYALRLEKDIKQLKTNLSNCKTTETELRSQIDNLMLKDNAIDLNTLRQENRELQSRLQSLLTHRQLEKQTLAQLERKLLEEKKVKSSLESLLTKERKVSKKATEELSKCSKIALECEESCKIKQREVENETKQLKKELDESRRLCTAAEKEKQLLTLYKNNHNDVEILVAALRNECNAIQERNMQLERSLSEETRIKIELLTALGGTKREKSMIEVKLQHSQKELELMKSRLAQILAIMPNSSFSSSLTSPSTSSIMLLDQMTTSLDPNTITYNPNTILEHLILEA